MLKNHKECIFCSSYDNNKNENLILYENNQAYSIFSYKPSTPAHSLIIVKKHICDLENIKDKTLEEFIQAIPLTFEAIQKIYDNDSKKVKEFYERIIANPPEQGASFLANQMLKNSNLYKKPIAYNWGMNCGYGAGQRQSHIHIHLFPRRKEGLGIATAMRKHLSLK